jgi:hypothetical protein
MVLAFARHSSAEGFLRVKRRILDGRGPPSTISKDTDSILNHEGEAFKA